MLNLRTTGLEDQMNGKTENQVAFISVTLPSSFETNDLNQFAAFLPFRDCTVEITELRKH